MILWERQGREALHGHRKGGGIQLPAVIEQPPTPLPDEAGAPGDASPERHQRGLVHAGASTSICSADSDCLRTLNRLWAMIMSPIQAGPTTRTVAGDE